MEYFDEKQRKLICTWHNLSEKSEDYYMAFISEWIAFNAICYNLYHEKAILERASIDRKKSKLGEIEKKLNQSLNISAEGAVIKNINDKWQLDVTFPDRLFISISKTFTEDNIFTLFVEDFSKWYLDNLVTNEALFLQLKKALKKSENGIDRYYVINMARSEDYRINYSSMDIVQLDQRNIIKLCETNELLTIKNVLYQIRCNIFHGEKTPGDINDDRIVRSALPLLRLIVNYLMEICDI
ncbi:MAG: hypothetical protein K9I82_07155 [Chitinophagaceae bacterium]|nr:hypothetical protein [Chitinophagaceae bacterium]